MSAPKNANLDRRINGVVYASLACVIVTMFLTIPMAVVGLPRILDSTEFGATQVLSDRVEACRAQYDSAIALAEADLLVTQARDSTILRRVIGAVISDDDALLRELGEAAREIDPAMSEAIDKVQFATEAQAAALDLAERDQDAYLATCET